MRYLVLLAALAGCASGNVVEGSDTVMKPQAIYQSGQTGTLMNGDVPLAAKASIDAPPPTVWLAVKKVYADLDIPVTFENATTHQIGNPNFWKSHQLGNQRMTEFVNCGSGMTGPNAASWRIYFTLMTDVNPDGKGGTNYQTVMTATGQDVTGGSVDRIPCGSTGKLEQLILTRVKTVLGK